MTLAYNPKTRWQMKTMKYYIVTVFPQPIHSIISHFISVIAFTPYSPKKQKFNKFVREPITAPGLSKKLRSVKCK